MQARLEWNEYTGVEPGRFKMLYPTDLLNAIISTNGGVVVRSNLLTGRENYKGCSDTYYLEKYIFPRPIGTSSTGRKSINCTISFAILNANADIVNDGFTPNEDGTIAPSTT